MYIFVTMHPREMATLTFSGEKEKETENYPTERFDSIILCEITWRLTVELIIIFFRK